MLKHVLFLAFILLLAACQKERNAIESETADKTLPEQALAEWKDQKFSMFIHFGLYSMAGGMWNGDSVKIGYSEQIRAHGKIPKKEYAALAEKFNPVKWNPDSIALLAKSAGMRSVVITSKHHDGFALFHTKQSKFNVVDATPYKRDIIRELADACKRNGLKFGVYFSLIDWDFPEALPISDHNSDSIPPAHHEFNLRQVEELMTGYGPISEIWFDMGKPTLKQSSELAALVRRLQPNCLISGRLWNDQGDFAVMGDNASPDFRMGTPWQTPASMFDETWGYRSWQKRGDPQAKANEKINALVRTVANGGNYLLNIGPMGDGSVVPFERDVLNRIGRWMSVYGYTLYATSPAYIQSTAPALFTSKPGYTYIFLPAQTDVSTLMLPGFRSPVKSVHRAETPSSSVAWKESDKGLSLTLPVAKIEKGQIRVLVVSTGQPERVEPAGMLKSSPDGDILLTFANGTRYHSYSGADYYTTRPTLIRIEWAFEDSGTRTADAAVRFLPADSAKTIRVLLNDQVADLQLAASGPKDNTGYYSCSLPGLRIIRGLNLLQVMLKDQSNPHRDIGLEKFEIRIN